MFFFHISINLFKFFGVIKKSESQNFIQKFIKKLRQELK
jgi:hypothetical protein